MRTSIVLLLATGLKVVRGQDSAPSFHPCPFLGPSYPKPTNFADDKTISGALDNITVFVEAAFATGQIENETTAVSLTAFSTKDKESTPFYSFHHTPPSLAAVNPEAKDISGDSVYRIGSVSKALTVYNLLVASGFKHWQSPITDFVPELRSDEGSSDGDVPTAWDEITLEALASHLGGIGVEYGALDLAKSPFPYTELGLPEPPADQLPPCGGPLGTPLCTREQVLEGLKKKDPVFTAYSSPAYSNVAFQFLAYAVESITGDSFANVLQSQVFDPLEMTHSSYGKPEDSLGVIPTDSTDLWWNVSIGDSTPGGGMYASPNDLARLGRAFLSHEQLSPTQTNRWLRPLTHTSDLFASVGAPWEIQRYTLPSDPFRTVDLYSKSGLVGLYTAYLVLIPDYDIGFTINIAGSLGAIAPLADLMAQTLVPALEEAARLQAEQNLSGQYTSTDDEYSFVLSTAPDTPGLHLTNFTGPEDSDQLATLAATALLAAGHYETATAVLPYFQNGSASAAYEAGLFGVLLDLRLFPTITNSGSSSKGNGQQVFRAVIDMSSGTEEASGPFTGPCLSWQLFDTVQLGAKSFDRFVFQVDEEGKVESVEHPFLRQTFRRVG